jgi:pyruvate,orthophosphate dikinase
LKGKNALYLTNDKRGRSLEEEMPDLFAALNAFGAQARIESRDELEFDFTLENGEVFLLDARPARRSARATVRIAVDLSNDGAFSQKEALKRVEPRTVSELLHPQIAPLAKRDVFGVGIPASPGAAVGQIVFTANGAQSLAARDIPAILVRSETGPEDIRGMHSAKGVLTERGGITSHAAVIARGLGLPGVVGASELHLDPRKKTITAADGRIFSEGDVITVDGTTGQVLAGETDLVEPSFDDSFQTFLGWATKACDLKIRANADTPADAITAKKFGAEGIGLCRTEHMFFEADRLTVMREMIFADTSIDRRASLERLLPMQRTDFAELFRIMGSKPVCIRLFDPPLHEFLPQGRDEMQELAEALDIPVSKVIARAADLREYNPMLGMRGVRLGITMPEIYEMQARAIFEATVDLANEGHTTIPEVMIPLVSAHREVELVKGLVDGVALAVSSETGVSFDYKLGVMVETPRAALKAGDLAKNASFLSFGTNDLTQMTYGLSRDDAGRFMSTYVREGVFEEDPFHTLDREGVGELLKIASERGRKERPELQLSICGEHAGDPATIGFCYDAGFDYVSCSPYRVPVARLAAARHAIMKDE